MTDNSTTVITAPPDHSATAPKLIAEGLSKRYGAVQALSTANLSIGTGEVHALVGENGSGKSTLVGILSGTVHPDEGSVLFDQYPVGTGSPAKSQAAGIITVFQDGSLLPDMSIAQNLYLGIAPAQRPSVGDAVRWANTVLAEYGFDVDTSMNARDVPPGDRQLIEIIRAVTSNPKLLVLDEATSALDSQGVDLVLDLMRRVAAQGGSVLFVTHRLSEVMRVADKVSVLRDGQYQGTHPAAEVTTHDLVELMAGVSVDMEFPERGVVAPGPALLSTCGLAGSGYGPVEITLRAGEIVGIAGADGNGQLPLLRGLASLDEHTGTLTVADARVNSYRQAVRGGVVYLSSDRKSESLFNGLTVGDNVGIGALHNFAKAGFIRLSGERSFIADAITRSRIRVHDPSQLPSDLSGGNQQKVALSRVLAMKPRVVLIDEPTQGVDVRSRLDIYRMLRAVADEGSAVVLVSSDATELAGVCDRIVVMSRGRVIDELPGIDATEESIVGSFAVEHEVDLVEPVDGEKTQRRQRQADAEVKTSRWKRASPETVRLGALLALVVFIAALAQTLTGTFLSSAGIYNLGLLLLPIAGAAAAQYFALLVGGIDVSVGAAMTLGVVLMSVWAPSGGAVPVLGIGLVVALVIGLTVGGANAFLIERMKIAPVIATIATMGIVSGVCLIIRPTTSGAIASSLADQLMLSRVGPVPSSLIGLVLVFVLADLWLRRTGGGLRLRAVGLNGLYATRLGIRTPWWRAACYLICSAIAGMAGVILAAQVGIGDPTIGDSYTLLSIAAAILGGAALTGGRGLLVGAIAGGCILVLSQSLVTVLSLGDGISSIFAGALTLIALLCSREQLQALARRLRVRPGTGGH